ncbi:MAG TPA: NADH-quinone oxidoreductase subunit A [Syntrophorhabdaceae bacterium]|jgi:NADH-quinone oxidoreductase subunit A
MNGGAYPSSPLWPLGLFTAGALGVVFVMIFLSYVLGERHEGRTTGEPYESGIAPAKTIARAADIRYFLVALFFVIFDVEALFIYAWAVCLRESGWSGYVTAMIFIGVLLAALLYLWRLGGLDWAAGKGPQADRSGDRLP